MINRQTDKPAQTLTHDISFLDYARLVGIKISWFDALSDTTPTRAANLFHTPGTQSDSIPKAMAISEATFELQFNGCPQTHIIKVRPPADVTIQLPSDRSHIDGWLHKHRFQLAKEILQTAAGVLLAIPGACAMVVDPKEGNEDLTSSPLRN
jgi:hypothetical protein